MRIESNINQNTRTKIQPGNKKKKQEKEKHSSTNDETFELSDETRILNRLLHATINQFTPCPFYFSNAAARNIKQACTIAKNIQNQADSMGITLNYTMIYDMVIGLASQNNSNKILWTTTITAEYEALNSSEKSLFENLHNACLQNQTPTNIIENAALKYVEVKQTRANTLPGRRECAQIIIGYLKAEPVLNHNNVKRSLSLIIKEYVTPVTQPEVS